MRISTENFDSFFSQSYAIFELRNLADIKETTERVCQRNSSEVAKQFRETLYL